MAVGTGQWSAVAWLPRPWAGGRLRWVKAACPIRRVWSSALVLYRGCWGFLWHLGLWMAVSISVNFAELLSLHFQSTFLLCLVIPADNVIILRTSARKLFLKRGWRCCCLREIAVSAPSQGTAGHRWARGSWLQCKTIFVASSRLKHPRDAEVLFNGSSSTPGLIFLHATRSAWFDAAHHSSCGAML